MEIEDADRLVELAGKFIPEMFPYTIDEPGPYKVIKSNIIEIDGIQYVSHDDYHGDQVIAVPGLPHALCFQKNTPYNVAVYYIRKAIYERDRDGS